MSKLINVLKECGEFSLPRVIAAICVSTAVALTFLEFFLNVFLERSWANYTIFITSFLGAGFILPLVNKGMNSTLNTPKYEVGKPGVKNNETREGVRND